MNEQSMVVVYLFVLLERIQYKVKITTCLLKFASWMHSNSEAGKSMVLLLGKRPHTDLPQSATDYC